MTNQSDIARLAKTSLKTVSRVINNDPLVNERTRERILKIIHETGYVPNEAARMMRSQRSNIIGFLSEDVATTSSSIELVRGAQDEAHANGKQMMLFNIRHGETSEAEATSQLTRFRAEAFIFATSFHRAQDLPKADMRCVLLNCFDKGGSASSVLPDDFQLGCDLTREVFRRGYRRPMFLNLDPALAGAQLRAKGYVQAGAEQGIELADRIVTASAAPEKQYSYFINAVLPPLMSGEDRPDVLICGQDYMAMPVYFELARMGVNVGTDIGVTSFDNLQPLAQLLEPGLSTMELPYYEMGRLAVRQALADDDSVAHHKVAGHFVDRVSLPALTS